MGTMDSRKIDANELMDSRKIDAHKQMDFQKIRESNLTGALKIDENSSCVEVWKNDRVEIIHCQNEMWT